MAIILGSCGCGCGSTCEEVTTNCNFVLRKYDNNTRPGVSWTSEATEEEIACYNSTFGCPDISFEVRFSVCTGEGEVYRSGGGGGGNVCFITTDEGPQITTVPCCTSVDLYQCFTTFYNIYDAGSNSGELYNGSFSYQGVVYTVSGGTLELPEEPSPTSEDPAVLMSASEGVSLMSSGTLLGTFTVPYEDESIDFDNIGEVGLTDGEKNQPSPPCKFSYNFSFTPEEGIDYYVMALPCDDTAGYSTVSLAQDGRAYFISNYNETTKLCSITQTSIVAPDTNAPESQ